MIQFLWDLFYSGEAITKEVHALCEANPAFLCGSTNTSWGGKYEHTGDSFIYPSTWWFAHPAPLLFERLKRVSLNHAFASYHNPRKHGFVYKHLKQPLLLTITSSLNRFEDLDWSSVHYVVVENPSALDSVPTPRKKVIMPFVDSAYFKALEAPSEFKALSLSSPANAGDVEGKGVKLFKEACRDSGVKGELVMRSAFGESSTNEVHLTEGFVNPIFYFSKTSVTVTVFPDARVGKSVPQSALESLASNRPIVVGEDSGLRDVVEEYHCGLAVEKTVSAVAGALEEIKGNYGFFRENCRRVAEAFFSKKRFVDSYARVYEEMRK